MLNASHSINMQDVSEDIVGPSDGLWKEEYQVKQSQSSVFVAPELCSVISNLVFSSTSPSLRPVISRPDISNFQKWRCVTKLLGFPHKTRLFAWPNVFSDKERDNCVALVQFHASDKFAVVFLEKIVTCNLRMPRGHGSGFLPQKWLCFRLMRERDGVFSQTNRTFWWNEQFDGRLVSIKAVSDTVALRTPVQRNRQTIPRLSFHKDVLTWTYRLYK